MSGYGAFLLIPLTLVPVSSDTYPDADRISWHALAAGKGKRHRPDSTMDLRTALR